MDFPIRIFQLVSGSSKATAKIPLPVCTHRGERLTMAEGKQHEAALLQIGVKCNTCSGKRSEFHCSKHQFTNVGKCRECPDFTPPNG